MNPEPRENIVEILIRWRIESEVARGMPADRAQVFAEREVSALLDIAGRRRWYLPGTGWVEHLRSHEARNEAIIQSHRRGTPGQVVRRTFRIGRTRYYEIINGRRSRTKKGNGEAA